MNAIAPPPDDGILNFLDFVEIVKERGEQSAYTKTYFAKVNLAIELKNEEETCVIFASVASGKPL